MDRKRLLDKKLSQTGLEIMSKPTVESLKESLENYNKD